MKPSGQVMLTGPAVHAAEAHLKAYHSNQAIYLDGEQIELEAYAINGSDYVKSGPKPFLAYFRLFLTVFAPFHFLFSTL